MSRGERPTSEHPEDATSGEPREPSEREMRDLRDELRMLAAHVKGIVFEFDRETRYVGVWSSDPRLLARPIHEMLGRTIREVIGDQGAMQFIDRIERVFATGQPEAFEYVLEVQGGRRWFSAEATRPMSRHGGPMTVTFLVRDVTERRQIEAQLRRAEKLAAVGLLAAGVAHEVNNPLGYLMLNLERTRAGLRGLVAKGAAVGDMPAALEMAWEGAERVRRIVQDLTTFARSDEEARARLDVRRVLDLAADTVHVSAKARARMAREYDEVPAVSANEGRLLQVFINLITNAAQSIAPGAPAANEVRLVTATTPAGWAQIEVRDTGTGIAPSLLSRIFDPFFTTKGDGDGTGLGLSICHRIVESLGGRITVESELGRGSAFRVLLPPATP